MMYIYINNFFHRSLILFVFLNYFTFLQNLKFSKLPFYLVVIINIFLMSCKYAKEKHWPCKKNKIEIT